MNQDNKIITKGRLVWVDYMKAMCLALMVICHAGLQGYCTTLIYAIHIPALFLISGYLYKPHNLRNIVHRFIYPMIIYALISFAFNIIFDIIPGDISLTNYYYRALKGLFNIHYLYYILFGGSWFVVVLIIIRLISGDIKALNGFIEKNKWHIFLICLASVTFYDSVLKGYYPLICDITYTRVIICLPFFILGMIVKENPSLLNIPVNLILTMALSFIILTATNGFIDIYQFWLGRDFILTTAIFIIGFLIFANLFHQYCKRSIIIETISNGTLLILGIHSEIIRITHLTLKAFGIYDVSNVFIVIITSSITISICYFIIVWSIKHCPVLIGK